MTPPRREIRFLLNDREVRLSAVAPEDTLLDFLRLDQRLRGTKEGCAEGDCGACTVLVGRLAERGLVYEAVNACIRLIASLDACHVVTIEALSAAGAPHPVQAAIAEAHGSQCGFCTPGVVMALYALWLSGGRPSPAEIETALQGNLCRCTGYAPILRAAADASERGDPAEDPLIRERDRTAARLRALSDGARIVLERDGATSISPAEPEDLAEVLSEILAESAQEGAAPASGRPSGAVIVAGATDVGLWTTKEMRRIAPAVFLGRVDALRRIAETEDAVEIGAGVSYADLLPVIARRWPALTEYWLRIGGAQVRNMGTIGGNIANGSPIGDTPPPFIALGATLVLRSRAGRRRIPLEAFFLDYGLQDRRPDEFIESVRAPDPAPGAHFAAYKLSKRRDEDISAVAAGFQIELDQGRVVSARLAFGGMAATPKRAAAAEAALIGAAWSAETVDRAAEALTRDFTPISDWRASAEYRMTAAANLIRRLHLETTGAAPARLTRRGAA